MVNFLKKMWLKYKLAAYNAWLDLKFGFKNAWKTSGDLMDDKKIPRLGGKYK